EKQREVTERKEKQTIHTFYGIQFEDSNRVYHYLKNKEDLEIGDLVLVPVGRGNEPTEGTVVSVQHCLETSSPYPVEKTKKVIGKR
ncbi:MAG: hypothetical protein IKZ30_07040, partial [Oscillospiraceae bacterium]|nr:hypothetical protein [Oscillospiraceae bacterium]